MNHRIQIENIQTERAPFRGYKTALRRAISAVLQEEGFSQKAEVSVTLVSREEIRRLNHQYRGIDRETDVLSFPMLEKGETEDVQQWGSAALLGDIIVCPEIIFSQGEQFGTGYRKEFCLMVIHSTLHLLGWDHIEEKEQKLMFALQEKILDSLQGEDE